MKNGLPALVDGITQLKDGAMQLSDGLSRFYEEGIQKLIDTVDDAENLIERLKATLTPSQGIEGVKNFIIETVEKAGAESLSSCCRRRRYRRNHGKGGFFGQKSAFEADRQKE